MLKRMWHNFFGHPNVTDFTCATCGQLRRSGELSDVNRPVKADDHMSEYTRGSNNPPL